MKLLNRLIQHTSMQFYFPLIYSNVDCLAVTTCICLGADVLFGALSKSAVLHRPINILRWSKLANLDLFLGFMATPKDAEYLDHPCLDGT